MMRANSTLKPAGAVVILLALVVLVLYLNRIAIPKDRDGSNPLRNKGEKRLAPERDDSSIPSDDVLENMTLFQLSDFFHGYILSTQTLCSRRVRMGSIGDGGWDMCEDPRFKIDPTTCLVYSYGISRDYTFDVAMEKYGCEVHSYDPSLGDTDPSKGQKFHFYKIGIGAKNTETTKGWRLMTLGRAREVNGHSPPKRRLDMVKMDVEGAELGSLMTAVDEGSLKDVSQLAFEVHVRLSKGAPRKEFLLSILKLLRRLWLEGFRLYHTNRNIALVNIYNNAPEGKKRTACYELYMVQIRPH